MQKDRTEYKAKWRREHREHIRAYRYIYDNIPINRKRNRKKGRERYWKNRDKILAKTKTEEKRAVHNKTSRKWAKANPEKVRASKVKYNRTHVKKIRESNRKWRKANPEKVNASSEKWANANPEKTYAISAKWAKANPKKVYASTKKWRKNNPEKAHAHSIAYQADLPMIECVACGSRKNLVKHHPDYNKPLEVVVLCRRLSACHFKEHAYAKKHGKLHSMQWWIQYAKKYNRVI